MSREVAGKVCDKKVVRSCRGVNARLLAAAAVALTDADLQGYLQGGMAAEPVIECVVVNDEQ